MNPRGFVIFVVLLVIVAMAAGLTSVLQGVRGQSGVVRSLVERNETRLAARSAALAITASLHDERNRVLAGETPRLSEEEEVLRFEEDAGWQWSLHETEDEDGEAITVTPFSARLDLNNADASIRTRFIEELAAEGEDDARRDASGPFRTLGMIEDAFGAEDARLFTVMSLDPPLRSGAGGQVGDVGEPRLIPGEGGRLPVGLSRESLQLATEISEGDVSVDSRSGLLQAVMNRSIPTEDRDVLLDLFDFSGGEPAKGRIDLSAASASLLATLPGMDLETAEHLVEHRSSLSDADLAGFMWPLTEELVDAPTWMGCIDLLTTRSTQLGVTFTCERSEPIRATVSVDEPELLAEEGPRVTMQMVVDLSGAQPRIAYLRDITHLAVLHEERARESSLEIYEVSEIAEDISDPGSGSVAPTPIARPVDRADVPAAPSAPPEIGWGRFVQGGTG